MGFRWANQKAWSCFQGIVLNRPVLFIVGVAALTLIFLAHIPDLSFRTSIYDLIIEDIPENFAYKRHMKVFGSDEMIRVVVRAEDVYEPVTFMALERLSEAAEKIEGVKQVVSLPTIRRDLEHAGGWSLDELKLRMEPVELLKGNVISEDHEGTAINLILHGKADKDRVIEKVAALISGDHGGLRLYQIGIPLISNALTRYAEKDFFRLPPLTIAAIALVLLVLYRNIYGLFFPLLTVISALVWTLGMASLLNISISLVTMVVPIFIIAVGTAYCLHFCSHYLSNARVGGTRREIVQRTLGHITLPTFLAVVTTVVGIGSLWVNRIPAIREFSILACLGMGSLLVLMFTFLPAALCLVRPPEPGNGKANAVERLIHKFLDRIVIINTNHPAMALGVLGGLTVIFGLGIFLVRVETNPMRFFKEDVPVSRHFQDIYKDMSGSFPAQVVVRGNAEFFFESPGHVAAIKEVQEFLGKIPGVDKTVSFADYLELVNYVSGRFDPESYRLPEEDYELRILINNYKSLLGDEMLSRFMDREFSSANILLLTHLSSTREFRELNELVRKYSEETLPQGMSMEVTGLGMVLSAASHSITTGQIKSLSITLLIVFLIMVVLFLSLKVGLIALLPNCFPIIVNFGLMGLLGIELSVATSLIACVVIGLAVDDTIHYLVRYSREFKKDLNKDRALRDSVMAVGRPVLFTTFTISIGFSFLIFSHFQPTAVFGLLMVVTMVSALMADLILLPCLMLRVELVTAWDLLKTVPYMAGVSAGAVHELNQPLNAIKMGSEFLRIMVRQGGDLKKDQLEAVADEISSQVDRASTYIGRLTDFQGRPDEEIAPVDINESIRDCLSVIANQLRVDDITLKLDLAQDLPTVKARQNRMTQVVYNLVANASEAVERAASERQDAERVIEIQTALERGMVRITVRDTGDGVHRRLRERIFEPFFTTKVPGAGKGLGLSISREIVRTYHGTIRVRSEPGEGATFEVILPVAGSD